MNGPSGESRKAREGRQGVVFTPPELARRLAEPLLASLEPGTPILDPACGDGALLLAALEGLGGGPEAAERLHGIEIESDLANRARRRLAAARGGAADPEAADSSPSLYQASVGLPRSEGAPRVRLPGTLRARRSRWAPAARRAS